MMVKERIAEALANDLCWRLKGKEERWAHGAATAAGYLLAEPGLYMWAEAAWQPQVIAYEAGQGCWIHRAQPRGEFTPCWSLPELYRQVARATLRLALDGDEEVARWVAHKLGRADLVSTQLTTEGRACRVNGDEARTRVLLLTAPREEVNKALCEVALETIEE